MLLPKWCIAVISAFALLDQLGAAAIRRPASAGCGTPHNFPGQSREFSFESSGGARTYRIHLPSNYDPNDARPLLIVYHGSGGYPEEFEAQSQFSDESINPNMITVYPAGTNGNWQGPTYATPGVSDKIFTTDLVNRIKDNYCVQETRVYATATPTEVTSWGLSHAHPSMAASSPPSPPFLLRFTPTSTAMRPASPLARLFLSWRPMGQLTRRSPTGVVTDAVDLFPTS